MFSKVLFCGFNCCLIFNLLCFSLKMSLFSDIVWIWFFVILRETLRWSCENYIELYDWFSVICSMCVETCCFKYVSLMCAPSAVEIFFICPKSTFIDILPNTRLHSYADSLNDICFGHLYHSFCNRLEQLYCNIEQS